MFDKHIEFFEGAFIEKQLNPLARRELAARMLRIDTLLPAAQTRLRAPLV